MLPKNPRLGVIGFGEVGYHISKGLKGAGISHITAYNNGQRNRPPYTKTFTEKADSIGVNLVATLKELAENSDLILSTVIPKNSVEVAIGVTPFLTPAHLYVDLNSCSPAAKQKGWAILKKRGERYVDGAILGGRPLREEHRSCIVASGEGAEEFRDTMSLYGMNIWVISGKVGDAVLLKQIHSVIGKGLQALVWECFLALHKAGLDAHVYDRLNTSIARMKLADQADNIIGRSAIHAGRRAGEMEFAADTLRSLGVEPIATEATAKRLAWCASFNLPKYFPEGLPTSYKEIFRIIDTITQQAKGPKD